MIDFACRKFNLDEIVKCSLGLTRTEYIILTFLLKHVGEEFTSSKLASSMRIGRSTTQKALKKLSDAGVLRHKQMNMEGGGYCFAYTLESKEKIRKAVLSTLESWLNNVESELSSW